MNILHDYGYNDGGYNKSAESHSLVRAHYPNAFLKRNHWLRAVNPIAASAFIQSSVYIRVLCSLSRSPERARSLQLSFIRHVGSRCCLISSSLNELSIYRILVCGLSLQGDSFQDSRDVRYGVFSLAISLQIIRFPSLTRVQRSEKQQLGGDLYKYRTTFSLNGGRLSCWESDK